MSIAAEHVGHRLHHRAARDEPDLGRELGVRALVVARELRRGRLLEPDGRADQLHRARHEHRQLADLVVRVEDVVDLALHDVLGRLVGRDHGVGHVPHVHERAPHPASAVQEQPALDQRVLHEGVDHQVVPHARAVAVDRAVAEDHRAQALVLEAEERLLAVVLRGRVGAARLHGRVLVVHSGGKPVVERAGGREDDALHAALDAGLAERLGGHGVHLPVGLGVVLGRRIVREAGEVDHAVHAVEGGGGDVAHVGDHELDPVAHALQRLLAPVEAVEHADLVAALEQALGEYRTDVAGAARHEDGSAPGRLGGQAVAASRRLGDVIGGFAHRAYATAGRSRSRQYTRARLSPSSRISAVPCSLMARRARLPRPERERWQPNPLPPNRSARRPRQPSPFSRS